MEVGHVTFQKSSQHFSKIEEIIWNLKKRENDKKCFVGFWKIKKSSK